MPGFGLVGSGGAQGGAMALQQMIEERLKAEAVQRQLQQQEFENQQKVRALGQTDTSLGLAAGRLGEDKRQFDEGAPARNAGVLYTQAQTTDLNRQPLEQADARAQQGLMAERNHLNELAQIKAQGDQSARVAGIRTVGGGGDDLRTFEEKEKIKAKYSGARPSLGAEKQALSFYNRMKDAIDTLQAPDPTGKSIEDQYAGQNIVGQLQGQMMPNLLQSETQQKYRQLQRAYTEARLRKESGAAIPDTEFQNDARTYFAQPGDTPDVIKQKREKRQTVMDGLKFTAGRAYDEFYGGQGGGQAPQKPLTARNPKTGEVLISEDGGQTWHK